MLDQDTIQNLKQSLKEVGQIYSIIVCKQHPDRVLAGKHRLAAGHTNRVPMDIDDRAKKFDVSHEVMEQLVRIHSNKQRVVSREETKQELIELTKLFEKQGIPKEQIASLLAEKAGLSRSYVYELLPDEYKGSTGAGRPKVISASGNVGLATSASGRSTPPSSASGEARSVTRRVTESEDESKRKPPYSRGFSETASSHRKLAYTEPHLRLFNLIKGIKGTNFLNEEAFERKGEFTRAGEPKSYRADVVDYDLKLVVEAMCEGSSSDDPGRDESFQKQSYEILKFTNDEIEHASRLVYQCTELKVENIRLKTQLKVKA